MLLSWKSLVLSPLLQYMSCLCCGLKSSHWRKKKKKKTGKRLTGESENNKAVHFVKQGIVPHPLPKKRKGKKIETEKNACQFDLFLSHLSSLLQSDCKERHLSEQWLNQHQELWENHPHEGKRVNVWSTYVFVGVFRDCDKLLCCQKQAAGFQVESNPRGQGSRSQRPYLFFFCPSWQGESGLSATEDWIHWEQGWGNVASV